MSKPEEIDQAAWDDAGLALLSAHPREAVSAAIMADKAEEREACAELCGGLRHEDRSAESDDWVEGTFACQAAIRARGTP